jgi:DNA-binding transcriptional regulator YdaS (Cro superfamily)
MQAQPGTTPRRPTTGRYTYRSKAPVVREDRAPATDEHDKLIHSLTAHKQLLSQATSAIRALTAARNEMIAQALEDGLSVATISAVTGENMRAVRTIGLAYGDLHPSGLPRSAHLDALKAKSAELDTAGEHRERIEDRREALIVMALRSRACDDIELASLTGLTPDHIRKATRRIRRPA